MPSSVIFPNKQAAIDYVRTQRWLAHVSGANLRLGLPSGQDRATFVQQLNTTAAALIDGINKHPTTAKQIDAAIAAVAPNSPSSTQPSLTDALGGNK